VYNRSIGYDLIRSFCIIVVFVGHIIDRQSHNAFCLLISDILSPGLTMSLLGFISGIVLSSKYEYTRHADFLIARFIRIYIPLITCLILISIYVTILGQSIISQHSILHVMGLSGFFFLFGISSKSPLGQGLWFVTIIIVMYLLFPLFYKLFKHKHGVLHLLIIIISYTICDMLMYISAQMWNVSVSFCVGAYMGFNGKNHSVDTSDKLYMRLFLCAALLAICIATKFGIMPVKLRRVLYALYPLAFTPVFFAIAHKLPKHITAIVAWFSGISYEFYILHFYFINDYYPTYLLNVDSLSIRIIVSFILTLCFSYLISRLAALLRNVAQHYFINSEYSRPVFEVKHTR